ncbi:hypothetical protein HO579_08490 [Streptococcus suis]|nr:hypothetical protein [Streptococcus suis]NQI92226.1 hypothetical protein [Streptococcus suis]NQJ01899.1 hypothetical protein [Streptococcus suis]
MVRKQQTESFVYVFELKKDCFPDKASRNRAIKQIETLLRKRFSNGALELSEERIKISVDLENMSIEEAAEKFINWLDDLWCRSAITMEE